MSAITVICVLWYGIKSVSQDRSVNLQFCSKMLGGDSKLYRFNSTATIIVVVILIPNNSVLNSHLTTFRMKTTGKYGCTFLCKQPVMVAAANVDIQNVTLHMAPIKCGQCCR